MRIYENKPFARFARRNRIPVSALCEAVAAVQSGRADADLGSGVFKQRVARAGAGKSGGYRVLLILKLSEAAFFVHGFAKSEQNNIATKELSAIRKLADILMTMSDEAEATAVASGVWIKVECDAKESR